jgi:Glyoxalase-like domain
MRQWVHVCLDLPREEIDRGAEFWCSALGCTLGDPWPDLQEFRTFLAPDGGDPYLILQLIGGPPRIHLDFEVFGRDRVADRLLGLGASQVRTRDLWRTLQSPGGLPFCLVEGSSHGKRPAARGPAGRRSRLVQVCIDSPAALHEREVAFWRDATGWHWVPSTDEAQSRGFAGKLYPDSGSPIQLLLQRLGSDDPATSVRAHLDLGCDDREVEAARLVALGATRLWDGTGWITLSDPAGLLFCATGNSPDAP